MDPEELKRIEDNQEDFSLDDTVGFLAGLDLFQGLDRSVILEIEKEMNFIHLHSGEYLFRQGDRGEDLYLVMSGRLRYYRQEEGEGREVLAEINRGESIGEAAILTGEPYFASVQAIRDSYLVKLTGTSFLKLIEKHPKNMTAIARTLITRMRRAMESMPESNVISTIAVYPLVEQERSQGFIRRLAQVLGEESSVLLLNSDKIEAILGRKYVEAPRNSSEGLVLVRWLTSQEAEYDFVIFELHPRLEQWTRRSLRQSDVVIILGESRGNPEVSYWEENYLNSPKEHKIRAMRHLVLLHESREDLPRGTAKWKKGRKVHRHHHLVETKLEDYRRLGRLLSGRSVGVVLGGGGAKGLAHIGVIRALREGGIPIDTVGGASMGAVLGAQVAALWDYQTMYETTEEYMRGGKGVLDYTFPVVAFLAGQRLSLSMKSLSQGRNMEDLWLNFFCVSANLNTGRLDVLDEGILWKAVRASSSLPAIFPPVRLGKDWHIDGGVLNNLPTDIMRQYNPQGKIIAIDVSTDEQFTYQDHSEPSLSGWYVLWRKLNPFANTMKIPSIVDTLMRSIELTAISSKEEILEKSRVDLHLRPPVQKFGMMEFKAMEEIVEAGYRYTLENMERWKEKLDL